MDTKSKSNPFKPGSGLIPPYLAGREKEQKLFKRSLDTMAAGESVRMVVMFGPRGMGKTVLLDWLEEQCVERGVGYVVGDPAKILGSIDDLGDMLLSAIRPPEGWRIERMSISSGVLKVDVGAPDRGTGKKVELEDLLISRCRENPLVVLLDEAHAPSDPDALRLFLNMAQRVAQKAPFLLVLAGTPRLTEVLRNAEATFIERAESIGLGCLDKESAAAALRLPLEKDGITITESALDQVVEDNQCYPFFIQQWGEALWNRATEEGISELTQDDVNSLSAKVETERTNFYESRYEMIGESPQTLAAAAELAGKLIEEGRLDRGVALNIIESSLGDAVPDGDSARKKAQEIMRELGRADFFWRPPWSQHMEPGVPSFITYVRDRISRSRLSSVP